jgi:hypothetical protein
VADAAVRMTAPAAPHSGSLIVSGSAASVLVDKTPVRSQLFPQVPDGHGNVRRPSVRSHVCQTASLKSCRSIRAVPIDPSQSSSPHRIAAAVPSHIRQSSFLLTGSVFDVPDRIVCIVPSAQRRAALPANEALYRWPNVRIGEGCSAARLCSGWSAAISIT